MTEYFRHKTQTTHMGTVQGRQGENYVSIKGSAFGVNNLVDIEHFKRVPELEHLSSNEAKAKSKKPSVSDGDKLLKKLVKAGLSKETAENLLARYESEDSIKEVIDTEADFEGLTDTEVEKVKALYNKR